MLGCGQIEKLLRDLSDQNASEFVTALTQYVIQKTEARRKAILNDPDSFQVIESLAYSKLSGKLGQLAVVAFKVGRLTTAYPAAKPVASTSSVTASNITKK